MQRLSSQKSKSKSTVFVLWLTGHIKVTFESILTFQQFLRWWVSVVTFLIPLVLILLIWVVILAKLCKGRTSKEVKVMDSQQPSSSRLSSQKRKLIKSPPL